MRHYAQARGPHHASRNQCDAFSAAAIVHFAS